MSEESNEQGTSGNRWEPDGSSPETAPGVTPYRPAEAPGVAEYVVPAEAATAAPTRRPAWLTRTRVGVAGGAAVVLLAGGVGGFALGHGTADGGDGITQQQGGPAGFDRDGDGFRGGRGGPGPGQAPDGQAPDSQGQDTGQGTGTTDSSRTDSSDT